MVYVDELMSCMPNARWRWRNAAHLYADTLDELHAFATKLGLKLAWFQQHPRLPHYDLTTGKRQQAVRLGALPQTAQEMVAFMKQRQLMRR